MPLSHRVLVNLGCIAQLSQDARRQLVDDWKGGRRVDPLSLTLPFESIEFLTTTTHGYE
jgi:hypothetical protein